MNSDPEHPDRQLALVIFPMPPTATHGQGVLLGALLPQAAVAFLSQYINRQGTLSTGNPPPNQEQMSVAMTQLRRGQGQGQGQAQGENHISERSWLCYEHILS